MEEAPSRQLLKLITNAVSTLEAACARDETSIPDLYQPFHPASEVFRQNVTAAEAASTISAAALQLDAILTPPFISVYRVVTGVSQLKDFPSGLSRLLL
jgi:hypothetical protein